MEINKSVKKLLPCQARIIHSGDEYFSCLSNLIDKAQKEILLHVYIFDLDETGNAILEKLKQAVNRGVTVSVLVDAYGSANMGKRTLEKINDDGIFIRRFEPLVKGYKLQVGRRLHHKVIVIDEQLALVGGINISNHYHGTAEKKPWLDFAILLQGNSCRQLAGICRKIEMKKFLPDKKEKVELNFPKEKNMIEILARVRQTDWVRGKNQIRTTNLQAIRSSEKSEKGRTK